MLILSLTGCQRVKIRDTGSMHGTYLNGNKDRLPNDELAELKDGDIIKFGIPVWRGQETFAPTSLRVGICFFKSVP